MAIINHSVATVTPADCHNYYTNMYIKLPPRSGRRTITLGSFFDTVENFILFKSQYSFNIILLSLLNVNIFN